MLGIGKLYSWCYRVTGGSNMLALIIYACKLSLFVTCPLENCICYLYQMQGRRLLMLISLWNSLSL